MARRPTLSRVEIDVVQQTLIKTLDFLKSDTPLITRILMENAPRWVDASPETAIELLQKISDAFPDAALPKLDLSAAQLQSTDAATRKKGFELLRQVAAAIPTSNRIQFQLASFLAKEGTEESFKEALEIIKKIETSITELKMTLPEVAILRTHCLEKLHGSSEHPDVVAAKQTAEQQIAIAKAMAPDFIEASKFADNFAPRFAAEAQLSVNALVEKYPSNPRALEIAARVYLRLGKYEKSIALMNRCHELQPESREVLGALARVQIEAGNTDEANRFAALALALHPQALEASFTLAQIALSHNDIKGAMKHVLCMGKFDMWLTQYLIASLLYEMENGKELSAEWFKLTFASLERASNKERREAMAAAGRLLSDAEVGATVEVTLSGRKLNATLLSKEPYVVSIPEFFTAAEITELKATETDAERQRKAAQAEDSMSSNIVSPKSDSAAIFVRSGSGNRRRTTIWNEVDASGKALRDSTRPNMMLFNVQKRIAEAASLQIDEILESEPFDVEHRSDDGSALLPHHDELGASLYQRLGSFIGVLETPASGASITFVNRPGGDLVVPLVAGSAVLLYNFKRDGSIDGAAVYKHSPVKGDDKVSLLKQYVNRH